MFISTGNGWYGDLGAMRFMSPARQPLINGVRLILNKLFYMLLRSSQTHILLYLLDI